MQILRQIKDNNPIHRNVASAILTLLQIQIIVLFFINKPIPIVQKIFKISQNNTQVQLIIVIIFALNLMQLMYFLLKVVLTHRKKSSQIIHQKSSILSLIQIKPYLFFVQIVNFNAIALRSNKIQIISLAIINIIFIVLELFLLQIITVSYRFIEKNHIRRKNTSILPWLFIIPIVFTLHFYDEKYASIFLLLRALTQLYFNFNNLENEEIRFCDWFFPLMSIQFIFVIFANFYLNMSIFSNVIILLFTIFFSIFCCHNLSEHLLNDVLKFHLKDCHQILECQNQDTSRTYGGKADMDESQMKKNLLQLRIMVNVHFQRLNYYSKSNKKRQQIENFDNWWNFYDRLILDHRVYCQNVTCQCNKFQFMKCKDNQEIEKKLFAEKIYSVIKKLQIESSASVNKLKIIENYFLIEMEKKPMKTYYQLIKIEKGKLNRQETLEVENLIHETRDTFTQLFLRQKVQNTDLNIEALFQFQDHLKDMRSRLNNMAVEYRLFYEVFANNFVQMQALKQKTRLLTEFKIQFSQEIDFCLKKFDKSLQLMTFCMVYFRFFDEYTNKLQKVEEKVQYLMEAFKNPLSQIKRGSVDIFDPHYGAVKADLVFNPGKIITITKNLCHTLGFTHQQLAGQKINKMMPTMFSRNHDKFLRTFVEKGSLKMLKFKEKIYYAKSANKFLMPLTVRLKIDHSNSDGLYAVTFIRPSPVRSDFIIMNNYGKIQEITSGIYNKIFNKSLGDEVVKVKKLCASKLLLSLNYLIKDTSQNQDHIYEGLIVTSDSQEDLMSYFKFPQFGKSYRGKSQNGSESSRSVTSTQQSYSNTDGSRTLDFSQDMTNYSVDLKESLRKYFMSLDIKKVRGYRVSYRFYTCVTSEFKFKILQIVNIREELNRSDLTTNLRNQILDVGHFIGLEQQELLDLKVVNRNFSLLTEDSEMELRKSTLNEFKQDKYQTKSNSLNQQGSDSDELPLGKDDSQSSSLVSADQETKKKDTIVNSFEQKTFVSINLQNALTILILLMAVILAIICIFSIRIKGNYETLQNDNSIINNFRINFLLRLAVQQLQHLYSAYDIAPLVFLQQKKILLNNKMRQILQNSISWVSLSKQFYKETLELKFQGVQYNENMSMFQTMQYIYYVFCIANQYGQNISQNYGVINSHLLKITSLEEESVLQISDFYKIEIHVVVSIYLFILIMLVIVFCLIKKSAIEKEDKIIDFLPFLKSSKAKKNVQFFQKFIQYNKNSQDLDSKYIQELLNQSDPQKTFTQIKILEKEPNNSGHKQSSDRLIRILKNQTNVISSKTLLFSIGTILLCFFVIGYAEYFFLQTDTKFMAFMQLKYASFLVQLIPQRIILLYMPNTDQIFHKQPIIQLPQNFITLAHDKIFYLMTDLASNDYHGMQMEKVITEHFTTNLCKMIDCENTTQMGRYQDQQLYFLAYRYVNVFNYLRRIMSDLPNQDDPKQVVKKWIQENKVLELFQSLDFILDLVNKNQKQISTLFTKQLNQIGVILLCLSLTLIPILIIVMINVRKKFIHYVFQRLQCTENIYKHITWATLAENTYAINYFVDKLKNSKKF